MNIDLTLMELTLLKRLLNEREAQTQRSVRPMPGWDGGSSDLAKVLPDSASTMAGSSMKALLSKITTAIDEAQN